MAALNTKGKTSIVETNVTRDHTENMLSSFDADIFIEKKDSKKIISINGQKELTSNNRKVNGLRIGPGHVF